MKTPDYLTYDRYKENKKKVGSKNSIVTFVVTFFITLLVFTAVAKSLSPDVDVTIGNDSQTDAKDTGLGVKKFIDDRLKLIQMDDNSAGVSMPGVQGKSSRFSANPNDNPAQTPDEKVSLPQDNQDNTQVEDEPIVLNTKKQPPRPSAKDVSTPFSAPVSAKVIVGRYATFEQAKVAQEILLDSGLNITPFVRSYNGSYTLQVGSYTSRAKAEELSSQLQQNNFPARIIQE